jgi:hypothetical protein
MNKAKPVPDRLLKWSEPDPNSGCWLWFGTVNKTGYGKLTIKKKTVLAHRASVMYLRGEDVSEGAFVCHHCDTPQCINPNHLYVGTAKDNYDDSVRRGRRPSSYGKRRGEKRWSGEHRGENNPNAKLTLAEARFIASSNERTSALAKKFGVSVYTIKDIKKGRTWKL